MYFYSVHNDYGDLVKPKRGWKYKFSTEDELKFVSFTEFCWEVSIPKTMDMLKADIVHYLEYCGLQNTFKNGEPSKISFVIFHNAGTSFFSNRCGTLYVKIFLFFWFVFGLGGISLCVVTFIV